MKTTWLAALVAAAVVLACGLALVYRAYQTKAEAPLFRTDLWLEGAALGGQLMLRREAAGEGALLVRHSQRPAVYAYDPAKRTLAPAAEGAWERAAGAIAECGAQTPPAYSVLRVDATSGKLLAGTREVETAGRTALALRAAPTGRRAAVLSSTGAARDSVLPSLGGGGASGQYLHQVLSLPDAAPEGRAVRVPRLSSRDNLSPCWSADEQFVVYHHVLFHYLSVVETASSSTPKKVSQ